MGNLFKQKGELDHALENYQRAIEIKPDFAEAYNNLSTVLSEKGNFEDALMNYKKAKEMTTLMLLLIWGWLMKNLKK